MSNACKYDCAYCINRRSNDIPRATFTPKELIELTLEFYRRNYIEGLFLSSAVVGSPDRTMEMLVQIARELRTNSADIFTLRQFPAHQATSCTKQGFMPTEAA